MFNKVIYFVFLSWSIHSICFVTLCSPSSLLFVVHFKRFFVICNRLSPYKLVVYKVYHLFIKHFTTFGDFKFGVDSWCWCSENTNNNTEPEFTHAIYILSIEPDGLHPLNCTFLQGYRTTVICMRLRIIILTLLFHNCSQTIAFLAVWKQLPRIHFLDWRNYAWLREKL